MQITLQSILPKELTTDAGMKNLHEEIKAGVEIGMADILDNKLFIAVNNGKVLLGCNSPDMKNLEESDLSRMLGNIYQCIDEYKGINGTDLKLPLDRTRTQFYFEFEIEYFNNLTTTNVCRAVVGMLTLQEYLKQNLSKGHSTLTPASFLKTDVGVSIMAISDEELLSLRNSKEEILFIGGVKFTIKERSNGECIVLAIDDNNGILSENDLNELCENTAEFTFLAMGAIPMGLSDADYIPTPNSDVERKNTYFISTLHPDPKRAVGFARVSLLTLALRAHNLSVQKNERNTEWFESQTTLPS